VSLKHALLGILSYGEMTGYEVKQFFDSSVQHFWNAELSQIYPTLKSLEENSFVTMHVEQQENRPNRKVYQVTDAGREEFLRWVREPLHASNMRDPFLIKIFFGTQVPIEDVLILLRRHKEEQQMVLAFAETVLRDKIRESVEHTHSTRNGLYWTLTLEMAISYRRAYVDWCEKSMHLLEQAVLESGESAPDHEHPLPGCPPEDAHIAARQQSA